jgi:hypothetical protein
MALQHKQAAQQWAQAAEINLTAQDKAIGDENKAAHRELAQIEATLALSNAMLYLAEQK